MRSLHPTLATARAVVGALALLAIAGCGTGSSSSDTEPEPDAAQIDAIGDASGSDATDADDATAADTGTDATIAPESRSDGDACEADVQCASGLCLTADDGFPEGMCSVSDCESRRDCNGDGRACLRGAFNGNLCVQLCEEDVDCRDGYECVGDDDGRWCYPAYAGDALNPTCESDFIAADDVDHPIERRSMNRHRVSFELSEDATSFFFVAWDRRGEVYPESFELPGGETLLLERYASFWFSPITFQSVAPVLVPGGPRWQDLIEPGTVTVDIGWTGGADDELCWIVLEETAGLDPGDETLVLDMNFYFVGVNGLDSENADDSSDFAEMLSAFDTAWGQAGIVRGDVRYIDVTGDVADRFSVIREQDEVFELVQLSRQPGDTRSDLLSVNVFFIRGFAGNMGSTLGVSAGIPGVAGIHGSPGTGLVFSANNLGRRGGNELTGQTLAHELGHFLGLFHTTERGFGGTDPIDDTPACPDIGNGNPNCPDVNNLMFPLASWSGTAEITTGQSIVLRANPLTKRTSRTDPTE